MTVYARVAVPRPLHRTFIYRLPEGLEEHVRPGARVVVPFGRRELTGWVDEVTDEPGTMPARVRDVLDAPDPEAVLAPDILELCRWISEYYVAPIGLTFRAALPAALTAESTDRLRRLVTDAPAPEDATPRERALLEFLVEHEGAVKLRTVRRALGPGPWSRAAHRLAESGLIEIDRRSPETRPPARSRQIVEIAREVPSLRERDELFGRARRQRELFEYLESVGGRAEVAHVADRLGISRSVVQGLVERGLARVREEQRAIDMPEPIEAAGHVDHSPTEAQAVVIERLLDAARARRPAVFVLRGVTGSGKTLVYIRLLQQLLQHGDRGAIVLVPEIALTPQTLGRFRAAFGDDVALLHSGLSEAERHQTWQAIRRGERRIVIGARSAVFAPVPSLGAIILDEEHEGSYKQSDPAPRYHAREVAVVRARRAGAICVLGSATPSLESWSNAAAGRWKLLELPDRIAARPLPPVRAVDLRRRADGNGTGPPGPSILSETLRSALEARLERREQAILLLNRRGYAAFIQCRDCGAVRICESCNVSLTYHRRPPRLVCHYCNRFEPVPIECPACGSAELSDRGVGTEQVERVLIETFPEARVARMDVDTTSARWSHHDILRRVTHGEVDVLLGTQMIAKGLDFPNVTLVGVINADVGLNLPDFRASERTFQLLTQVAGRAGRGPRGGEVILQTALPGHYAVRYAVAHDFEGFAGRELDERRTPGYPPALRLAGITISGPEEVAVQEAADATAGWLHGLLDAHRLGDRLRLVGPAPCPIDRIRGRWRWHLLVKSSASGVLTRVLGYFARKFQPPAGDLRVEIDRDPVNLL